MLPHARPGGIAGLLEMLADHNGRDDMYRLADELAFEIDDLLPIVEAAALLGFVKVRRRVEMTPEGRAFVEADILRRKELFRDAALRTCRAAPADHPIAGGQVRPHASRRVLPRPAGRTFQRREDRAATGDRDQLGPLRGVIRPRLRRRSAFFIPGRDTPCRRGGCAVDGVRHCPGRSSGERTWSLLLGSAVFAAVLAVFYGSAHDGALLARGRSTPTAEISRSPSALPLYAFYSLVRMAVAYVLSLIFAVGYGYIAAYNQRVRSA